MSRTFDPCCIDPSQESRACTRAKRDLTIESAYGPKGDVATWAVDVGFQESSGPDFVKCWDARA